MKKEQFVITKICVEISDFVSFLKKYEAEDRWLRAFIAYRNVCCEDCTIESILNGYWALRWDKLITDAFIWINTSEGFAYWGLVDQLWNDFLVKNKVENAEDCIVKPS